MSPALVYAYPWDFEGDEGAAERAAALGVDGVALAAAYHAARAARPMHPSRPLVDVEHAAFYVPVRPAAWVGRRLVPRSPTWVASADSFGAARRSLAAVGLTTHAWVVLTHNSALGSANPDLVVRNAFGDAYSYALCPSSPEVVEYCATLVDEILLAGPVDGLVLEACGPMGFEHNGLHEKTSLASWSTVQRQLMSLCFCTACIARCTDAGLDVPHLQRLVRRGAMTEPESVEQALGRDLAAAFADVRNTVTATLRALITERGASSAPRPRMTLHAAPDAWATGSFSTVAPKLAEPVDVLVAQCFEPAKSADALAALRALGGGRTGLGAFVQAAQDWSDERVLESRMHLLRSSGVDELHLYHLGLVGPRGWDILRRMVTAFERSR
jgi:hypothetical protein